jgi:hypothetical protein
MAEDAGGERTAAGGPLVRRGPTSDADFNKIGEQADWDAYKKEKGLSFAANKSQYAADFANYRKRKGQSQAPAAPAEDSAPAAAGKAKLQGAPMPKQEDYGGDLAAFGDAMRKWREQNRTAKDAASALASKTAPPK